MDNKKIGRFISKKRKDLSMTQQNLADKLNITNKAVSKWERGDGYPDISILPALSEVLKVTVDELLEGEENEEHFLNNTSYSISNNSEQARYLLNKTINTFDNNYLISLCIVIMGIAVSTIGLKLYDGLFTLGMFYPFVIAVAFLSFGMVFYVIICRNFKREINEYKRLVKEDITKYNAFLRNRHMIFAVPYMFLVNMAIVFMPLYPFRNIGFYKVYGKVFGPNPTPDWPITSLLSPSSFFIDYYFFYAVCTVTYILLTSTALIIIKRKKLVI